MQKNEVKKPNESMLSRMVRHQMFIPVLALVILAVFNLIADPAFFKITVGQNSSGNMVLDRKSVV